MTTARAPESDTSFRFLMFGAHIIWDLPDESGGNVEHIAEHDLTVDEVESVLLNWSANTITSRSSGELVTFGYTSSGRYIAVVWEHVMDDPLTIRPITAYETKEPL